MNREFRYWADSDRGSDDSDTDTDDDNQQINIETHQTPKKEVKQIPKIPLEIQSGLNRLRQENPESCDIAIIAGEHTILAHKLVLSSCSLYFNAMFTQSFAEKDRKEVILNELDNDVIKILIDYIYTSYLPYDADNVQRILLMARFLQIDSAEELCAKFLIDNINIKNCLELIQWAGIHSVKTVCDVLIKFIAENFYLSYVKPEFSLIEIEEFQKILSEKCVLNFPEDTLFTVIIRWIRYDNEKRIQYLNNLLSTINSSHVTSDLLLSPTLGHYLPSSHCLDKWKSINEPINLNEFINWDILIFKRTGHFQSKLYKPFTESTVDIKCLPKDYFDGSYINYGGTVYYFGGCLSKQPVSNETYCYNIYKNRWTPFIPMKVARAYHRSCIMNGQIYTCGGSDGHRAFKSTECIDLISGEQIILPDMLYPREAMGLTSCNNAIYVIGGRNRGICRYYSCERYDPRIGQWELLRNTAYQLCINSCTTVGSSIYCTNGSCNSMERYDVHADQFTEIITQYRRYPNEVFEMRNELYGLFKDHAAMYETTTGKWKIINQFGYHDDHLVALPIPIAPHDNYLISNVNHHHTRNNN